MATGKGRFLAFRFDVDSVRCLEHGVPRLIRLGKARNVRFSFFVNMGYSFNWTHNLRHFIGKRLGPTNVSASPRAPSLTTRRKLGMLGVLKTMFLNPRLGHRYKPTLDAAFAAGHELALHGGTDHVIWQRSLPRLTKSDIDGLLRPAYDEFAQRYGRPSGFASPGFVHNADVYELLDAYGFQYSSDEPGEEPFRPQKNGQRYDHYQVPVNVAGRGNVPIVEQMLAMGETDSSIVDACVEAIRPRPFALLYGHPYVEGVRADLLEAVIDAVADSHEVVTVVEYLRQWKQARGR